MKTVTIPDKIKIFFDYYDTGEYESNGSGVISKNQLNVLKKNRVATIIVINFAGVDLDTYIPMVRAFEKKGLSVKSVYFEKLDFDNLHALQDVIDEINSLFDKGNFLILFNGSRYSGALIASILILLKSSADDSIGIVKGINRELLKNSDEISFIYDFQSHLKNNGRSSISSYNNADVLLYYRDYQDRDLFSFRQINISDIRDAIPAKSLKPKENEKPVKQELDKSKKSEEPITPKQDEKREVTPIILEKEGVAEKQELPDLKKGKAEVKKKEEIKAGTKESGESEKKKKGKIEKETKPPKEPGLDKKEKKVQKVKPAKKIEFDHVKTGPFYTTLRFKLISIISLIIIVSLSGMIYTASYFFEKDNKVRVQENNIQISEVIGLKVKSDFFSIIEKSKIIAITLLRGAADSRLIIENDNDIVFVGIAKNTGSKDKINIVRSLYNSQLLTKFRIVENDMQGVLQSSSAVLLRAFDGEDIVHNVSQVFSMPIAAIAVPFEREEGKGVTSILISFIKLERLLKAFELPGITRAFMLNDKGDIIAHPDSSIVVSGGNYINLPIAEMMMKSKVEKGQKRYKDENGHFQLASFNKIGIGGCGVIATVDEQKAFQVVYDIQRRNIYLMIVVLSAAIMIVFFFGKTITNPIIRLLGATKKIKEGVFNVDIAPESRDEIGELTSSFIEMGRGLEEREKMKDAFGKFVNKTIADQVLKGEIKLGGERKDAAVFFSDIRSFTSISEKMNPEDVVEFLNEYMTKMVKCVNDTNGVVDKYIGDAIMAIWGAPVTSGNDTENAINAALLMRKELNEFNKDRSGDKDKPIIKIGCGINSGPVVAGQIGSEERMEYTVIGDTVNLASRIESLNKPFGTDILISEDSYKIVKDIFEVLEMEPIKVKGKEKPQQIYCVLGRKDDPDKPKDLEELRKLMKLEKTPFRRRKEDMELTKEEKYEFIKK